MAIGQRIKHIRNLRGLTQKELGTAIGFTGKTSDVRIAQYESETRVPKDDLLSAIAMTLKVCPQALDVPNIDTHVGVMHTLFTLEDIYGLRINEINGELCLALDKDTGAYRNTMFDMLLLWQQESERFKSGEISEAEYNEWRYNYPKIEAKHFQEKLNARRKLRNQNPEE